VRRRGTYSALSFARSRRFNPRTIRSFTTEQAVVDIQSQALGISREFQQWYRLRSSFKMFGISVPKSAIGFGAVTMAATLGLSYTLKTFTDVLKNVVQKQELARESFNEKFSEFMQIHLKNNPMTNIMTGTLLRIVAVGALAFYWCKFRIRRTFKFWEITVRGGKQIYDPEAIIAARSAILSQHSRRALVLAPLIAVILPLAPKLLMESWIVQHINRPDIYEDFCKFSNTLKLEIPLLGLLLSIAVGAAISVQPFIIVPALLGNAAAARWDKQYNMPDLSTLKPPKLNLSPHVGTEESG